MEKARGIRGLAGRTRAFVQGRSRAQKVSALGAVALLATAPFGGLEAVEQPRAEEVDPGRSFRLGPHEITVDRARTVPDLGDVHRPELDGAQLLVFVIEVENVTDRYEYVQTLRRSLSVAKGADLAGNDDGQLAPTILHLADGESLSYLNPDVPVELAVIFEQRLGWSGPDATLTFQPIEFEEEDDQELDDEAWVVDETGAPAIQVTVPVKPGEDAPEEQS